jgi:hypothetical protein
MLNPHPGPQWALITGAGGMASCIEHVLGAQSTAYVLTDSEMPGNSQSATLETGLQGLNTAGPQTPGYTALAWTVTPLPGRQQLSVIEFGGIPLQIRHDPPYKLIVIRRP